METKYIFVLDTKGIRVTSFLIGLHADTEESCIQLAQTLYPNHTYLAGTQEMQNEFVANNKCYINGKFIDYVEEPKVLSKAERIAEIKAYYDKRFETLEQTLARRTLSGTSVVDLQEQYKKLTQEMIAKIKEVK
ncbi:hypothetical protein [Veillonella sp. VA141]|jgi:hypothetical protein|uniref:hypothetical protein n=1 Tax=Veillonella sp. VA141 TaxID=741833 RepID=UPI000F8E009E|nr:hypothetical protein [Veillonella sp. VA141]